MAPELAELELPPTPLPIVWEPLPNVPWRGATELPAAALDRPPPRPAAKAEPAPSGAAASTKPGGGGLEQQAQEKERRHGAVERAQQKYADFARESQRRQEQFRAQANRMAESMVAAYDRAAAELIGGVPGTLARIDAAAEAATAGVELAATRAETELLAVSQQTAGAVDGAGRAALALIDADDRTAAGRISEVVAGLVSGHSGAFDGAIRTVRDAADRAALRLSEWRDARATNYPTQGADLLENAKNEARQARLPAWVDAAATTLSERVSRKTAEWEQTKNSTVCGLRCSYTAELNTERERVNQAGRASVRRTLSQARQTLREQTEQGRRALADLRRSHVAQMRTLRQSVRSQLLSQARSTLAGLHQEAQGAVGGLLAAADGATTMWLRPAEGLEQALRQAAPVSVEALLTASQRAPEAATRNLETAQTQLTARLDTNRDRLERSLTDRISTHATQTETQLDQHEATWAQQGVEATTGFETTVGQFRAAFSGLAATVSQAAASWARPLATRMAGFIAGRRTHAQSALNSLLAPQAGPTPAGNAGPSTPEASCNQCRSAAGTDGAASGTAPAGPGGGRTGGSAGPQGLSAQADEEREFAERHTDPAAVFHSRLEEVGTRTQSGLRQRAETVRSKFSGGFAGSVDEAGVIAALRGLTYVQGRALDRRVYQGNRGSLDSDLHYYLTDPNEYLTASAYLQGNAVEGARRELLDSVGFFNDDEARIEAVQRALSPDQLAALGREHGDVVNTVRNALDGTDLAVFNALAQGDYALADAHRLRDAVDSARRDGNAKAVQEAIMRFTGAPDAGDWRSTQELPAAERRTAVVQALGGIVPDEEVARGAQGRDVASMSRTDRAVAYVTRDIEVYVGGGEGGEAQPITLRLEGANRDLAGALLRHGEGSIPARVARLGVEMQNRDDPPSALELDRAVYDERFAPDRPNLTPEERAANDKARQEARADRARILLLAEQTYGREANSSAPRLDPEQVLQPGFAPDPAQVQAAQQRLITRLRDRYGSDTLGADLAQGLLTDERPSPRTASLAMQHAMDSHVGTDEELLFRFTERMTRDEIVEMRQQYRRDTGRSLDAELGVYGEGGIFTELSGDDRLRMERALRGVARTDQERLEAAAFALQQQRNEAGGLGSWLAEGTLAEQSLLRTQQELQLLAGGPVAFNRRGELISSLPNFDATGNFTGTDRDTFLATADVAQQVAENYSRRIDAFADVATTGIAIVGAIAAAAITVVTAGAAGPLIAAAVVAGLASMSANYAIKGGRYGWEQAAIDLGMTAVQAVTAGVGAQLGNAAQVATKSAQAVSQASRTLTALSRIFTGNAVVDQIIVGALTGSIGGLANTAFDERTWEHSGGDAVGALLGGLLKGALSGAASAAVTNSIENIGVRGRAISERLQALSAEGNLLQAGGAMLARGGARAIIAGAGGAAGRATDLLVDASTGRFHGDAGEVWSEIGKAGLHSAVQGFGEGAAEAVGQRAHNRTVRAAEVAIQQRRELLGLPPLASTDLSAAAQDLLFLRQHGRDRGPESGERHLGQVALHGGLAPLSNISSSTQRPTEEGVDTLSAAPRAHADTDEVPSTAPALPADATPAATRPTAASSGESTPQHLDSGEPPPHSAPAAPAAAADTDGGAPPPPRRPSGPEGEEVPGGGGPRRAGSGGDAESDRLFPHLTDAEIDAAFAHAESGPLMRVGADSPGADTRPLSRPDAADGATTGSGPTPASEPSLAQRQQAAARQSEADGLTRQANARLAEAAEMERRAGIAEVSGKPERAERLRARAEEMRAAADDLHAQAAQRRIEAGEFTSGRRSATADLPGPDDVDALFAGMRPEPGGLVRVPLSDLERNPDLLPRLIRPLLEGEGGGRIVFRVESERSRSLVQVDAQGNVTIQGGASIHLNFGSFERAMEFVLQNSRGAARIIRFEVDENWVRSARSAAIPEHETAALAGRQPRLVDVRFADDQLEIPPQLIDELNRFIVPGSGVVHEIPGRGTPPPASDGPPDSGPIVPPPTTSHSESSSPVPAGETVTAAAAALSGTPAAPVHHTAELTPSTHPEVAHLPEQAPPHQAQALRDELLRHVPSAERAAFGDVPIVVLPAAEYRALTRSDSGPVVTLIRGGEPVVAIREGTPWSRLADEGPHLLQAREAGTRARVARLDEAALAHWDSLDLETRLDLYRNKVELEIDAHERILQSVAASRSSGEGDPVQLAAEQQRNESTLRALRDRLQEVSAIGPDRRAAIATGEETQPQYLDQPARLFSKDAKTPTPEVEPARAHEEADAPGSRNSPDEAESSPGSRPPRADSSEAESTHPRDPHTPEQTASTGSPRPPRSEDLAGSRPPPDATELVALRLEEHELHKELAMARANRNGAYDRRDFTAELLKTTRGQLEDFRRDHPGVRPDHPEIVTLERNLRLITRNLESHQREAASWVRRIEGAEARLAEIDGRRHSVAGEWVAEFDRLGERPPCFVAGTLVHTPEGLRAIESLAIGDRVFTRETNSGRCLTRRVLRPERGWTHTVVELTVAGERLTTTPSHRFWLPELGEWREASQLQRGTIVLNFEGQHIPIESAEVRSVAEPTFNLLIEGEHNYCVGVAGILVHNGKNPDDLSDSVFRDEITRPPKPFEVRYYVIVHADAPNEVLYVGSTEQTLAERLRGHLEDRSYRRGPKAGTSWWDEAGGTASVSISDSKLEAHAGPFIMRELTARTCHSHFERYVWELYYIENNRQSHGVTMQNDFTTPPVGARKFEEFRDYYLARLCAP